MDRTAFLPVAFVPGNKHSTRPDFSYYAGITFLRATKDNAVITDKLASSLVAVLTLKVPMLHRYLEMDPNTGDQVKQGFRVDPAANLTSIIVRKDKVPETPEIREPREGHANRY